jgi:hypothetical protein
MPVLSLPDGGDATVLHTAAGRASRVARGGTSGAHGASAPTPPVVYRLRHLCLRHDIAFSICDTEAELRRKLGGLAADVAGPRAVFAVCGTEAELERALTPRAGDHDAGGGAFGAPCEALTIGPNPWGLATAPLH